MNVIDHLVGAGREEAELVLRPDSSTGDLILMLEFQMLGLFFAFNSAAFASNSAAFASIQCSLGEAGNRGLPVRPSRSRC